MSQNILTAGNATSNLSTAAGDDGTFKIVVGPNGSQVDGLAIGATGNAAVAGTLTQAGIATPRMVLSTAQNTTSGTSKDFTSIPIWVNRITMAFHNVSTNGASYMQIQLGVAGVPTTSGYQGNSLAHTSGGNSSAQSTTGFVMLSGGAAGLHCGIATFVRLSGNTWAGTVNLGQSDSSRSVSTSASIALAGALDMVRLTTVNGTDTFDAGSVNILYEG